jgi:hypothetical protein
VTYTILESFHPIVQDDLGEPAQDFWRALAIDKALEGDKLVFRIATLDGESVESKS